MEASKLVKPAAAGDESTTGTQPSAAAASAGVRKGTLWTGFAMSGLVVLFLAMDSVGKLLKPRQIVEGTLALGYPETVLTGLGIVLLACTILYAIPRTAVLGVILLTGYLGGAVATHVRVGHPLLTHTLFPIYVAALAWGGLFLRDLRLRSLFLFRR